MNLVFATGFLIPQRIFGQEYFRGARAAFPGACFPEVPVMGSIETRANVLAQQIVNFRFPDPDGKIHVIAHSMGGLDTRFALHRNLSGLTARVASLSTIATPHRGSPIADLLVAPAPGLLDLRRKAYEALRGAIDRFGLSIGALGDLTTASAERFDHDHPDIGGVACHCYAGNGAESFPLRLMSDYIRRVGRTAEERDNDGLVSVASASWKPLAEPPWPTDHLGEVGHDLMPPAFASSFPHLAALQRVVARATTAG